MPSLPLGPRGRSLAIVVLMLSVSLAALLAATPNATAQSPNYISGNACLQGPNPKWQSGDTWIMYGDVYVPVGCTLTIEPGATVKGDSNVHLYINGTLSSNGTSAQAVQFADNQTSVLPWAGIQFNPGSVGSVSWSIFTRVQIAVGARSSSPAINNNTIVQASAGVHLDHSSSIVADNSIDGRKIGPFGIIVTSSNATLERNRINGTTFGIQGSAGGTLAVNQNTITNTSGATAIGVYLDNVGAVTLVGNVIQTVVGTDGAAGVRGGIAVGILLNGTAAVSVNENTIGDVRGGRGGDGSNSAVGPGAAGGVGGAAAAVALGSVTTARVQGNAVSKIAGNRGGNGGSSTFGRGGPGGAGGIAFALELFSSSGGVSFLGNSILNVTGGNGGAGGRGTAATSNGAGGDGADAYGIFLPGGMNPSISGNTVRNLRGGTGGDTPLNNTLPGNAGSGGNVTAVIVVVNGQATIHANTVDNVKGGLGGNSLVFGGGGGNATGVLTLSSGTSLNRTTASYNVVSNVTGGQGGVGGKRSGDGGNASGIGALHVDLSMASGAMSAIRGGDGGAYAVITNPASGGGSAAGAIFIESADGASSLDSVANVLPGATGGGVSPPASYAAGYFFLGSTTSRTRVLVTNGTVSGVNGFDLYVDNYTAVTTLNTSFSASKLAIMKAGNLTVQNFLAVNVFWPNNVTTIGGARIVVKDNDVESYNRTSPFGTTKWIVVTNREYIDSTKPLWNTTQVSVGYQAFAFVNNPRIVNMTESQTQSFTMIDTTAPTSSAVALPAWTAARTFSVFFTSSDGFGVGLQNVTLWYRLNGGAWTFFGNQSFTILGSGTFTFTASSDGLYEFATTAIDKAGNVQQPRPPVANNTWTIVDTVAPGSRVATLPAFETSTNFTVSWAPNAGVTDIATFTVQVNTGSGWSDWRANTTATSATYAASGQGPVAFRVLATDFAGNRESKSGNDTWTVVDTIAPQVLSGTPTGNLTVTPTSIVITFSEPMNPASVEAALQVSPAVSGTPSWSSGGRTLSFDLSQPLSPGTAYTVTIATGAEDLAGNGLAQASVFTFVTPAAPGLSIADLWPLFVVIAAVLAGLAFFLVRRRSAAATDLVLDEPKAPPPAAPAKKPEAAIDDVFLLYRKDGLLIKHETRRLRPDIDTDILSGMLTAVQQFVKDSFRGEEGEELNEMTVGQMHILIGRGKWLILAATITGGDMESMTSQIQACVQDMEDHNWDRLEEWNGDLEIAKALGPYLKKLIRGEYAA